MAARRYIVHEQYFLPLSIFGANREHVSDLCTRIFRASAIAVVEAYRRHVSPLKGFGCPHRLLYGGMSCSGYALTLLKSGEEFRGVLSSTLTRFDDCSRASIVLGQQNPRMRCYVIPCCFPV
jgi:putative component of membrane protein insertase Oxa1/YidC/SpoIIIJ protein YidD